MAILAATVAQFMCGAIWYSFIFGKLWGQINGFDKLPKAVQDKLVKEMGPYYGLQFVVTVITTVVLSILIKALPNFNVYYLAILLWFGFVVPTQVSGVLFGGTDNKWIVKKILVLAGASLLCLLSGAAVLNLF